MRSSHTPTPKRSRSRPNSAAVMYASPSQTLRLVPLIHAARSRPSTGGARSENQSRGEIRRTEPLYTSKSVPGIRRREPPSRCASRFLNDPIEDLIQEVRPRRKFIRSLFPKEGQSTV
eukprot:535822_1